jgi:hypothetical protein
MAAIFDALGMTRYAADFGLQQLGEFPYAPTLWVTTSQLLQKLKSWKELQEVAVRMRTEPGLNGALSGFSWFLEGFIDLQSGRGESADQYFSQIQGSRFPSVDLALQTAIELRRQGRPKIALAVLLEQAEALSSNPEFWFETSIAAYEARDMPALVRATEAAYRLNQLLLEEAESFLNRVNQNISRNQQQFSEQEVELARKRLDRASFALNSFKNQYGEVSPDQSATATSSFITSLESKLVDLKVEEASLKRQFKDPSTPEVAFVTDQVKELERQIAEERALLVTPEGRDFNRLTAESSKLQTEVTLATEALGAAIRAADSNRQNSLSQAKFLVRLAIPQQAQDQNITWRWQGQLAVIGSLMVLWGLGSFTLGIVNRR